MRTLRLGIALLSVVVVAGCGSDDTAAGPVEAGAGGSTLQDAHADVKGTGGTVGTGGSTVDAKAPDSAADVTVDSPVEGSTVPDSSVDGALDTGVAEAAAVDSGADGAEGSVGVGGSTGVGGTVETGGSAGAGGSPGVGGTPAVGGHDAGLDGAMDASDAHPSDGSVDATLDVAVADADAGPVIAWTAFLPLGTGIAGDAVSGTTLDLLANHFDAAYTGDVNFLSNAMSLGLADSGSTSHTVEISPHASAPKAPIDTSGSYSVSVWVTLGGDTTGFKTVVSAYGNNQSSFYLQKRDETVARFSFTLSKCDGLVNCVGSTYSCKALSAISPVAGQLYHLVATRDGTTGVDTLYVDGTPSSTTCSANDAGAQYGWAADTIALGHGKSNGGLADWMHGSVAGVGFINRVLTPAEVTYLDARGVSYTP